MSEPYTLVVTDIVGSTSLWDLHAEAFKAALARHDAALRRLLAQTEGYEIRTEGDGFRLAFFRATSALRFCLEAQSELAGLPWPGLPAPLRVRMGVFTGTASADLDSVTGRLDFRGPDLLAAERIAEAAHGEQILVGETTARLLQRQSSGSQGVALRPLGRWLLAGTTVAVGLWQAMPAGQPDRERPQPRAQPAPAIPSNLALKGGFLVGFSQKMAEIQDAFGRGSPIVALCGPGGVGKSALAMAFSRGLITGESYIPTNLDGGVWYCDRSETTEGVSLFAALAAALDLPSDGGDPTWTVVADLAARGPCLIVLDGVDRDLAALRGALTSLVSQATQVRLLLTTRRPVSLPNATTVPLDPLPVPALPASKEALAALRTAPVVELFAHRAREVLPEFRVGSNLASILRILHMVGGLPLVIELAAGRLRVLSLPELETRLASAPLVLLVDRRAQRPARHASLRGLLDQTWATLPVAARVGLVRLSVFQGSFDLPAAAAVLAELPEGGAAPEVIRRLEEEGLVGASSGGRLSLTGPVAAYALAYHKRLGQAERTAVYARHAAYFAAYGTEDHLDQLARSGGPEALGRLAADLGNLVGAFDWAVSVRQSALAAATARAALEVYGVRGPASAGLALARRALAIPDLAPAERTALTCEHGWLAHQAGEDAEARTTLDRAVVLASGARSPRLLGRALRMLAIVESEARRLQPARDACEAALSVTRLGADPVGEGLALTLRGNLLRQSGDLAAATADLDTALQLFHRSGAPRHAAVALANLAIARRERGDVAGATAAAEEALARFEEAGDLRNGAATRSKLGVLLADLGRLEEARALLGDAAQDGQAFGLPQTLPYTLWALGLTCLEQGDLPAAQAAVARAQRLVRRIPSPYASRLHALRAEIEARQLRLAEAAVWMTRAEEALARAPDAVASGFLACHRAALALCAGELSAVEGQLSQARVRFEALREITGLRATTRLSEALSEAQRASPRR